MPRKRVSRLFDLKEDEHGRKYMEVYPRRHRALAIGAVEQGDGLQLRGRFALRLDGLLPPQFNTLEQQIERVYEGYVQAPTDIDKVPVPSRRAGAPRDTVLRAARKASRGDAPNRLHADGRSSGGQQFSALYQNPRGISFSPLNIDRAKQTLGCYPMEDVRMIVATDSSAILGIGTKDTGVWRFRSARWHSIRSQEA